MFCGSASRACTSKGYSEIVIPDLPKVITDHPPTNTVANLRVLSVKLLPSHPAASLHMGGAEIGRTYRELLRAAVIVDDKIDDEILDRQEYTAKRVAHLSDMGVKCRIVAEQFALDDYRLALKDHHLREKCIGIQRTLTPYVGNPLLRQNLPCFWLRRAIDDTFRDDSIHEIVATLAVFELQKEIIQKAIKNSAKRIFNLELPIGTMDDQSLDLLISNTDLSDSHKFRVSFTRQFVYINEIVKSFFKS